MLKKLLFVFLMFWGSLLFCSCTLLDETLELYRHCETSSTCEVGYECQNGFCQHASDTEDLNQDSTEDSTEEPGYDSETEAPEVLDEPGDTAEIIEPEDTYEGSEISDSLEIYDFEETGDSEEADEPELGDSQEADEEETEVVDPLCLDLDGDDFSGSEGCDSQDPYFDCTGT